MTQESDVATWLHEHDIANLEMLVADMSGIARGKVLPADQFGLKTAKLPLGVFAQAVNADYVIPKENVKDRDMTLRPDLSSIRHVPWANEATACVIMDCFDEHGVVVGVSPRAVLQRVLRAYQDKAWSPVIAPEVEFYLADAPLVNPSDPYGIDGVHDLGPFVEQLYECCRRQGISVGAISQELGPAQFEVNFEHGNALKLADDVFHFKRTVKRIAIDHNMRATFLAKLDAEEPGSSMHIHQSLCDAEGDNVFSNDAGDASELFDHYIGGLQTYMKPALLMFAPFANSYRRFLSHYSSPVNLEWGIDNRTVGLRVPNSAAEARRVENRLAGSDVNPYLAIAGSLACGYMGMTEKIAARPETQGSAYDVPFALHRHLLAALDDFRSNKPLATLLGEEFVAMYAAVKELEYRDFQSRITKWERDELMYSV